jgi:hypothetical protein
MDLAIHIPVWLLYALGAVVAIPILGLAVIGVWACWAFKNWRFL